jgi:putative transposase
MLTRLKKEISFEWLQEPPATVLQKTLFNLEVVYKRLRKKGAVPSFKRKEDRQSAEYLSKSFRWDGKSLYLAKMKTPLKLRLSRTLAKSAEIKKVTVVRDVAGRYFVSMLCTENTPKKRPAFGMVIVTPEKGYFAATSKGEKISIPKGLFKTKKQLSRSIKNLKKKQFKSKNWQKERRNLNKISVRAADIRNDLAQRVSASLVSENQTIVVEIPDVSRPSLPRFSSIGWGKFISILRYKTYWQGRKLILVKRPGPKIDCPECYKNFSLGRHTPEWVCPKCGAKHVRVC